jgi:hypothetical protein
LALGDHDAKVNSVRSCLKQLTISWVAAIALAATPATAADDIGEALAVIDQASTEGTVGNQKLSVGMKVLLGDRVITDSAGEAQLLFNDGTRMVVGPNSELMLDEFVFRAGATENQFVVRALNGAFRFITGEAQKDAYLIQTPSATIGVRGTIFDFSVSAGETNLLLLHGGATVCGNDGGCTWAEVDD